MTRQIAYQEEGGEERENQIVRPGHHQQQNIEHEAQADHQHQVLDQVRVEEIDQPEAQRSQEVEHSDLDQRDAEEESESDDGVGLHEDFREEQGPPVGTLPTYVRAMQNRAFIWALDGRNQVDGLPVTTEIERIYEEIVFWRKNIFELTKGRVGKLFVNETARLFESLTEGNPMERFALKAMAVMPHLILQKSSRKMKAPEIRAAVEKRMDMWKKGQMEELFDIAQTIQQRFIESHKHIKKEALAKSFASLIFQGKINAAIRLLTQNVNAEQKGVPRT